MNPTKRITARRHRFLKRHLVLGLVGGGLRTLPFEPRVFWQISGLKLLDPYRQYDFHDVRLTSSALRGLQLKARGKHVNQVVVAIAREMAAFAWAIARLVPRPA